MNSPETDNSLTPRPPLDFARFKPVVVDAPTPEPGPAEQAGQEAPAYAELTPDQDAFIKAVQQADFAQLLQVGKQGISGLTRPFIPGEALPMRDPPGATHTFLSLYCDVAYVRCFFGEGGIKGLTLNDFLDTNQPGMASLRAEIRESFQPIAYARFVQATLQQHAIADQRPPIITLEEARKLKANNDYRRGPKH